MSSRRESLVLFDQRLDDCANQALNRAEKLRANYHSPPSLINPRIFFISLLDIPEIGGLAEQIRLDKGHLFRWAFNENPLSLFSFDDEYVNPSWQKNHWDPHLDIAFERAYETARSLSLPAAPPTILVGEVIESESFEDLFFARDEERQTYYQLARATSELIPVNACFKPTA
jgi:hypothetical protein